jgi:glycosyltransferase involved in cell wall biosynthesis
VRVAWFSPWPPQRSGIAGRSAELVPILSARGHAIDVFVDASNVVPDPSTDEPPQPGAVRVLSAHDFVWRNARASYDLSVYQIGNSHLHRFIWPYLFRFPGLAVLHDARVHHARAEALLSRLRDDDYRSEFAWNHPDVDPAAAELAVLSVDGVFYYQWPMLRGVVESARLVAAHSRGVAAMIARDWPGRPVEHVALGEGPAHPDIAEARDRFRAAHGLAADAIVFGVHGSLTSDKCVPQILKAFAATLPWIPNARLLLAGTADPWLDLDDRIARLSLTRAVCRVAAPDDAAFDRSIAASDITVNLRWPTALETSGPWVRALAMGLPTVVVDAAHHAHVPALDPRTWRRHAPVADLEPDPDSRAVAVALDVLDLDHSLRLAMRRLGTDAGLRERLGAQARAWWEREHTVARMTADYERAMSRALQEPLPAPDGPAHLRPDPAAHARDLLAAPAWGDPTIRGRLAGF